jgi:Tfp pilus assembly protein PilO
MRPLASEHRRLLVIGAAAFIVFFYLLVVLMPLSARGRELSSERESLNGAIERAQMMYEAAQGALDDVAALREEIDSLIFPEGNVPVNMVRRLERLAADTGLTITSIRPERPEMIDGAVRHPATFKLEADFSDLVLLMFALERPGRRLWVEGVEISAGRQARGRLQATFYVAAYAESEEGEVEDGQA